MSTVEELCGEYPEDFIKIDIVSNPNFVFENDPNFETITLFDVEGNTILVNSFTECENYVSGGWNYQPSLSGEVELQNYLIVILMLLITFSFLKKKLNKYYEKFK